MTSLGEIRRSGLVLTVGLLLVALGADVARGQYTERITVSSSGEQANAVGEWWYLAPMIAFSASGDVVAFSSDATNLVPRDTNRVSDIFVRDRRTGMTHRVSVRRSLGQANGLSFGPSLSADGRVVAFLSEATNLVRPRTKPRGRYVFVRDLAARTTERVDVSSAGAPGGGGAWVRRHSPPMVVTWHSRPTHRIWSWEMPTDRRTSSSATVSPGARVA